MFISILVTVGYVASIYLGGWVVCRACWLDRHHPRTIRVRCAAVLLYSLPFLTSSIHPVSWWPIAIRPIIRTFIFLIPIFAIEVAGSRRSGGDWLDFGMVRNIMVGPLAEEIIFRHSLYHLIQPHYPISIYRLTSSLLFALAHMHPLLLDRSTEIIVGCIVQFCFTLLFGLYVSGVYVQSDGSLSTCILVHSLCNLAGFPDLDWFDQAGWIAKVGLVVLSFSCILLGNLL